MQAPDLPGDKALLPLDGETMLGRVIRNVGEACDSVSVLCGTPGRGERFQAKARMVVDSLPGCGPLGGLEAALRDASEEWLLVVPVRFAVTAIIGPAILDRTGHRSWGCRRRMLSEALNRRQPLPVLVHRAAHPVIMQAIRQGERKLMPVLQRAAQAMCSPGLCVVPAETFASGTWTCPHGSRM